MKEALYKKLLTIQQQSGLEDSDAWASGQGIYNCLYAIFENEVHIIHPDLSSIHSPVNTKDVSGVINYIEAIEQLIKQDGVELKKPIIAIWNTDSAKQPETKVDFKAGGGSHWQTLVILPKYHKIHNGQVLTNERELVFFKDSYYKGKSIPDILKLLFKQKTIVTRDLKEGEAADNLNIELGGMLSNAEIYDETYKNIQQQKEGYDCGWWALYNAFMFVMGGSNTFLTQFNSPSRILGYKLRKIFSDSGLDLSIDNGDVVIKIKEKDWMHEFELNLRNNLIEQLKQKDQENFQILRSDIEKLNIQYLGMLSLFAEQTSLSDAYRTVESIMKEEDAIQKTISGTSDQKSLQHASSSSNNVDLRHDISGELTADGLKKSLHGNMYQLGLLTLAASRAEQKGKIFYLITEAAEFEKFDDLVIDYGESITFLQAKHSAKSAQYSAADFCNSQDGDASLAKYFDSWYILKNSKYSKTVDGKAKNSRYVFFTNRGIEKDNIFLEDAVVTEDDFLFQGLETKTLRFKKGQARKEFIDAIASFSKQVKKQSIADQIDFRELKKELADSKEYLQKKSKTLNQGKGIIIDGRSKLSEKVMALIKLSLTDKKVAEKIATQNQELLETIENSELLISVSINNPETVLVPGVQVEIPSKERKKIEKFLDEFIIKVEQPNSNALSDVIARELRLDIDIAAQEFFNALNNYMLEWFTNRQECLLRSESFGRFIEVQKGDLYRFYLVSSTKTYKEECKNSVINCIDFGNIEGFDAFLADDNDEHIAIIEDHGGGIKQKIYNTVSIMRDLKDDEWSFLDLSTNYLELLHEILKGESTKFLIIDCRTTKEINEGHLSQLRNIYQATIKNDKKLILLIDIEQKGLLNNLRTVENSDNFIEFTVQSLTDEQIEKMCNPYKDKYISLGGKEYKIKDIIANKIGSVYGLMRNVQYLEQIIEAASDATLNIESEMPYGVYIPNQMVKGEGYYDLSIITKRIADYYIIENIKYNKLLESLKNLFKESKERFSEADKIINPQTEFTLLRDITSMENYQSKTLILTHKPAELGDKKILLLRVVEGYSPERLQIVENPNNLPLSFPEGVDFSRPEKQEEFIETITTNGQLSILMSPAGYGKTSFCKNIIEKYTSSSNAFLPIWVIKVSLPKLQFDGNGRPILSSFININYRWQYEAFEQDYLIKSRVLIILDGFDEIKDTKIVALINKWINTIPKSVSLLITTREYAANKLVLPSEQNVIFYKLTEYTEEQREEYIKKYLKAILKQNLIEAKEPNDFITGITEKITFKLNAHSSRILGIPLERYIFCELLKPHLLAYVERNGYQLLEGNNIGIELFDISNTAKLYQEFILSKSMLFLENHLGVRPENIVKKSMIFNLMGSYNQIIELFALKQAFGLADITKYICCINFDIEALVTLKDTGLLTVSKDGTQLNFNHETYQEFYAAMAIIRGTLIGTGELYEDIKKIVQQNRYNPKFYFIFSIASQFSVSAGPMIPGYNADKNLLSFWEVLGDNGDVIGAGATRLFRECTSELVKTQKEMLLNKIEGKKWAKFLKKIINKKGKSKEDYIYDCDEEELPVSIQQTDDNENIIQIDMSKYGVAHTYKQLRKKGTLTEKYIEDLETATKQHEGSGDYWALDGGIEAIGETGKFFSERLAEYLILRANQWDNNEKEVLKALGTIFRSLKDNDSNSNAKAICFNMIQKILLEGLHYSSNESKLISLLYKIFPEFIGYLINNFKYELETLESKLNINDYKLYKPSAIFDETFNMIKCILLLAEKFQYAVLMGEGQIILVKDTKITITFSTDILGKIFTNILFSGLKIKFESDDTDNLALGDVDESSLCIIEEPIVKQLANDKLFDQYFDLKGKNKDIVGKLFELLAKYQLITKHQVEKLVKVCHNLGSSRLFWDNDGGIEAIGYTGHFFNHQLASHLKSVRDWNNNIQQAIIALKRIYETLEKITMYDEDNNAAIDAYNNCIKYSRFQTLQPIEVRYKDIATQTEEDDNISGKGYLELSKQYKEGYYIAPFYSKYHKYGLDKILSLRIENANLQNIVVLPAVKLDVNTLAYIIMQVIKALEKGFRTIIVPCNLEGKHWVGVLFESKIESIEIVYLDSEQSRLIFNIEEQFLEYSQSTNKELVIVEGLLEKQRYNNCGPEVIENFVYYLTGTRATQEAAVYIHSLLYENLLLNPEMSISQITENNQIIKQLSNQVIPIYQILDRARNIDYNSELDNSMLSSDYTLINNRAIYSQNVHSDIYCDLNLLFDKVWQYYKSFIHSADCSIKINLLHNNNYIINILLYYRFNRELATVTKLLSQEYIQNSRIEGIQSILKKSPLNWNLKDFKKIKLIVHPDKGGNNKDFIFVKDLQEKLDAGLNIQKFLEEKIQTIQPMIYKVGIGFKIIDTAIDTVRVIHEPTIDHAKKVLIDSTYLYSMYSGVNRYSSIINGADILYKLYQGECEQALATTVTTVSYMAAHAVIDYVELPHLRIAYAAIMATYIGYSVVINAYSLYLEYNTLGYELKSTIAYKELLQLIVNSPLHQLYDFKTTAKEYEIKINNISLEIEKDRIKQQAETEGEFSLKLYHYIYGPAIEEKYNLLRKILLGNLTEKQAETLKAKHIKITLEDRSYEHCVEIKNIETVSNSSDNINEEHYYCYNGEQQILEHIVIGENRDIEVISRL